MSDQFFLSFLTFTTNSVSEFDHFWSRHPVRRDEIGTEITAVFVSLWARQPNPKEVTSLDLAEELKRQHEDYTSAWYKHRRLKNVSTVEIIQREQQILAHQPVQAGAYYSSKLF